MTHLVKNLSRRLVSFSGNSGESWHIPPGTAVKLPDFELSDNAMVAKLVDRHLLGITALAVDAEAEAEEKARGKRHGRGG